MKKFLIGLISLALVTAVHAAAIEQFPPGFRLIDGTHLNQLVNVVNGLTGNGGNPVTGYFSANTGTGPTPSTGTVLQVVGANTAVSRIEVDAFGNVPIVTVKRYNGTKASPTPILSADQIGSFNYQGASTTALTYGPAARMAALATENWSSTAGGTKLVFSVTPNTTQTLTTALTIDQDKSLTIAGTSLTLGSTTFTEATLALYAKGVAAGYKIARGAASLDGSNPTDIATGLATLVSCNTTIATSVAPGVSTMLLTNTVASATLSVYGWKPTDATNNTLIASSGTDPFYWVCVGT